MKKKFLLPVMAMVVAIGMSFATESSTADPNMDYYLTEDGLQSIAEIDSCGTESTQCTVQLVPNGPKYPLFHDEARKIPKMGGGVITLY